MFIMEQIKWEEVYDCWKMGNYDFSNTLSKSVSAETVFVKYKQDVCIYGYDWLENSQVQERKQLIDKDPVAFLYFTQPSNKGTIQTAEMLVEAKNDEECAAIWIAATAKELLEDRHTYGCSFRRYVNMLDISACEFLRERYYLWHHAMRKLVPDILIPSSVLQGMDCKSTEPVIGLIQLNTALLQSGWSILRYSSLEEGQSLEFRGSIRREE